MGELKTKVNNASVKQFLDKIPDEIKRKDSFILLDLFKKVTGEEAKMWGTSIVGFGMYHYKSERSRQEGDWPLIGFSPRKQNLTLYISPGFKNFAELVKNLGKCKTTGGCLYINKLTDINLAVLEEFLEKSFAHSKEIHLK